MKIHHIGYVVSDIEQGIELFRDTYGYKLLKERTYDPVQHVWLVLLSSDNNYLVELIQPCDEASPSFDFMQKGGGMHHFCYEVYDFEETIKILQKKNHILFKKPVEAILLDNRKVAFLFSKIDKKIIELVDIAGE